MKQILALFLWLPFVGLAQPNLVSVPPTVGDSITVHLFEYTVPSYPKTGNNAWDFSSLSTSSTDVIGMKILNPSSTPYAADFPSANFCSRLNMGSITVYLYAGMNADSLWNLGSRYVGFPMLDETYVNPLVEYRFPFSYNQVQSDVYTMTDGTIDSSRTKYVGWGSIKTPFGQYNNVILLEDYGYDAASNTWEVLDYNWISVATTFEVAQIDAGDSTGSWYVSNVATTSVQEQLLEKYKIGVSPNPATDQSQVSFSLQNESEVHIQLIAVDGKSVYSIKSEKMQAGNHHVSVKTSDLANGIYFVRMVIDNLPIVTTLQVSR